MSSSTPAHVRALRVAIASFAVAVGVIGGAFTPRVAGASTPTTAANEVTAGVTLLSGDLTGPGIARKRHLSGAQAAAFMRSWLAYSIFGNPPQEPPTANAPVYTVTALEEFAGERLTIRTFYAVDTSINRAWVSMPPQQLGFAFVQKQNWIRAQSLTVDAFNKIAKGVAIPPPPGKTAAPTTAPATPHDGSSSSAWLYSLVAVLAVVVIALVVLLLRRRPSSGSRARDGDGDVASTGSARAGTNKTTAANR